VHSQQNNYSEHNPVYSIMQQRYVQTVNAIVKYIKTPVLANNNCQHKMSAKSHDKVT